MGPFAEFILAYYSFIYKFNQFLRGAKNFIGEGGGQKPPLPPPLK